MDVILAGTPNSTYPGNSSAADYDGPWGQNLVRNPFSPTYIPTRQELWFQDLGRYNPADANQHQGSIRRIQLRPQGDDSLVVETLFEPSPTSAWNVQYKRILGVTWDPWDKVFLYSYCTTNSTGGYDSLRNNTHEIWSIDPATLDTQLVATNIAPMSGMKVTTVSSGVKYFWGAKLGPGSFVTDTLSVYDQNWDLVGQWTVSLFNRIVGISPGVGHTTVVTRRDNYTVEVWPMDAGSNADRLQVGSTTGSPNGNTPAANAAASSLIADQVNGDMIWGDWARNDNGGVFIRQSSSPGGVLAGAFPFDPVTYFNLPLTDSFQARAIQVYNTTFNNNQDTNFGADQWRGQNMVENTGLGGFTWLGNDPNDDIDLLGFGNAQLVWCNRTNHFVAVAHRNGFESGFITEMGLYND